MDRDFNDNAGSSDQISPHTDSRNRIAIKLTITIMV
jgi:hypothetical protein